MRKNTFIVAGLVVLGLLCVIGRDFDAAVTCMVGALIVSAIGEARKVKP